MNFKETQVFNFEGAFRGMRNPKNSWKKSDSFTCVQREDNLPHKCLKCEDLTLGKAYCDGVGVYGNNFAIGPEDMRLAQVLIKGGTEHAKFMRQIFVSVDITAPMYWWSEFDTYKVGTVANSTSKMHKLTSAPITLESFEIDDMDKDDVVYTKQPYNYDETIKSWATTMIEGLEVLRTKYLETKNKKYWKELVRWLPCSYLQTRTVTMSYANIRQMVIQRRGHKLNEWSGKDDPTLKNFIAWARTLPYAQELIFYGTDNEGAGESDGK